MSRKILFKLIAASFALVGADAALACSSAAWTATGAGAGPIGGVLTGQPNQVPSIRRYAGLCGALSQAVGAFHRDESALAEPSYRARFYVYTGLTAGNGVVFRAADASDASIARVAYDVASNSFQFFTGADAVADATVAGVVANRWYNIELNFQNAPTPQLRYTVRGKRTDTPLANDLQITAGVTGTMVVDRAELGLVSGTGVAGAITTDAIESRRNTAIGALCRGNANTDTARNSGDLVAVRNEFLGTALATGNPDCNEEGAINSGDLVCIRNIFLSGAGACP